MSREDPDRRAEDRTLAGRVFHAVFTWWVEEAGWVGRTLSVALLLGGGAVQAGSCGAAWAVAYGRWEGLPRRVTVLERWREDTASVVADSGFERMALLEDRVDSLEQRFVRMESSMADLTRAIGRIEDLAESNNCWLRVNAGEESRFNCSGGIER